MPSKDGNRQRNTVCRTVCQYSRDPVPAGDMGKLLEIAEDFRKVKNYVYARYGGIGSLSKISPGYTVQNEMTESGLRGELGLPSVYFYLAVFDGLGDIKSQWGRTKAKVSKLIGRNETLAPEEKHYLRFLLKVNNAFDGVLNRKPAELPEGIRRQQEELAGKVDAEKLHRYLCRQVRKYHGKLGCLHTDKADGFSVSERAYRYGDHGIYISVKEKRKRVFVPLTDGNRYGCQVAVRLYPGEGRVEVRVPVRVRARSHADYRNIVGIALGMQAMLTTDRGHAYGEELGRFQAEYADWVRRQTAVHHADGGKNPGRKKYNARKHRFEERIHGYINQELNRFLRTEKPATVYMVKLPGAGTTGPSRRINHSVTMWQRGYIRKRLVQKCREQSVELLEVLGKDIGRECSRCGAEGESRDGVFTCGACGYSAGEKTNTAGNVLKRGTGGRLVR